MGWVYLWVIFRGTMSMDMHAIIDDFSFLVICSLRTPKALHPAAFMSVNSSDGSEAAARHGYRGLEADEEFPHNYSGERQQGMIFPVETMSSCHFQYGGDLFATNEVSARTLQGGPTPVPCYRVHYGDNMVVRLHDKTYMLPAIGPKARPRVAPHVRMGTTLCEGIVRVTTPEQLKTWRRCPLVRALLENSMVEEGRDLIGLPAPPPPRNPAIRPTVPEMAEFTSKCGLSDCCRVVAEVEIMPSALLDLDSSSDNDGLCFEALDRLLA